MKENNYKMMVKLPRKLYERSKGKQNGLKIKEAKMMFYTFIKN